MTGRKLANDGAHHLCVKPVTELLGLPDLNDLEATADRSPDVRDQPVRRVLAELGVDQVVQLDGRADDADRVRVALAACSGLIIIWTRDGEEQSRLVYASDSAAACRSGTRCTDSGSGVRSRLRRLR